MRQSSIFYFAAKYEENICFSVSIPLSGIGIADSDGFNDEMNEPAQSDRKNAGVVICNFFRSESGAVQLCHNSEKSYKNSTDIGAIVSLSAFFI